MIDYRSWAGFPIFRTLASSPCRLDAPSGNHRDQGRTSDMRASQPLSERFQGSTETPCCEGGEGVSDRRLFVIDTLWPIHAGTGHCRQTKPANDVAMPEPWFGFIIESSSQGFHQLA